ncbi:MAG: hypothetical protein NVSMB19_04330 [Vulcanimicrobiaceae bacterium]
MRFVFFVAALAAAFASEAPAVQAQELKRNCIVGERLTDRYNKTGTVVASDPNSGADCKLQFPDGTTKWTTFWMLRPAGAALVDAKVVASVLPGRYECWSGASGQLNYTFMDINIATASTYADKKGHRGRYGYDPSSQQLRFLSGTFAGMYAKYLESGKIGLASKETTFFNTVCDRKA